MFYALPYVLPLASARGLLNIIAPDKAGDKGHEGHCVLFFDDDYLRFYAVPNALPRVSTRGLIRCFEWIAPAKAGDKGHESHCIIV